MARRPTPARSPGDGAQRWQTVLQNRIPLAGGWLRMQSALQLVRLSLAGDTMATRILAQALDNHSDAAIRQVIRRHFSSDLPQPALNAAWQVWAESRRPELAAVLLAQNRSASKPAPLAAFSALHLNLERAAHAAPPDWVPFFVEACADSDPAISSRARYALVHLSRPESVATLCQMWTETRHPLLENALAQAAYQPMQPAAVSVAVALKFNRLELVTRRGPDGLRPLITACTDSDEEIRARARFCLANLQSQPAVNALCAEWLERRTPLLETAILQARYIASQPARLRLYTALKSGRVEIAHKARADGVGVLFEACADPDVEIATRAQAALRALQLPEAQEAVCQAVIAQDSPIARQVCAEMGYQPAQPEQRALFFFLTDQWDAYETLDFDQRLLNTVYQISSAEIRQRILRKVQQAGRTDFLNIVSSSDDRARAAKMTAIEAQLFVRVLAANREWDRLWALAQSLALPLSIEIVRMLAGEHWQPSGELDREIFTRLAALSRAPLLYTGAELTAALPPAVMRALLRIHGRVNSIAFAPHAPYLAIGSSGRRVAAWNYQSAGMNNLWKNFLHSIGEVTYTPAGTLLCAERSNGTEPCGVYVLRGDTFRKAGQHNGSVTALEALDDILVFTAGRDSVATVWDIEHTSPVRQRRLPDWPRAACLSADRARILLLHNRLSMLDARSLEPLPDLSLARMGQADRSVLRCAAFLPESDKVLAGQYNGQVILYQDGGMRTRARLLTTHARTVESVLALPERSLVVTAGAEGHLRFFSLPDLRPQAALKTPGERLTSLHVSPDGAFFATGANDSTLALWDLRVQDIPALFNTPAASIQPSQMALINSLAGYGQALPAPVLSALCYLQTLLAHRFRFDIEVSETTSIQVGEFDVFLD